MQNSIDDNADGADVTDATGIDFGLVMVVGSSPINRIVVSRISEKAGFRTICTAPEEARAAFGEVLPVLVILDGGDDNRECARIIEHLSGVRRPVTGGLVPIVIFLSSRTATVQPGGNAAIDKVVAKPVMPDRLQPVIQEMIDRLQQPH